MFGMCTADGTPLRKENQFTLQMGMPPDEGGFMKDKQTIMEQNPEERPDEKFLAFGPDALTDAELLAIILRTGSKDETSVGLAEQILRMSPDGETNILNICHTEIEELKKIRGIGKVKALQIKAVIELSRRIAMTSARPSLCFTQPESIANYYMEQLRHRKREEVLLLMLDSAGHLLKETVISVGTVNSAPFSPREIYLEALQAGAVNIVLLHNHPSGDPRPSANDLQCTERVRKAGNLLGISLIDHIIIGDRAYVSLNEEGFLDDPEEQEAYF